MKQPNIHFNKKIAKEEATFWNYKYIAEFIWGQTAIEGQVISYISTETFLANIHNKTATFSFDKEDNASVYTIDLLTGLKKGWDEIFYYLKIDEKYKLSLNELIHLNNTLSSFEPKKPEQGVRHLPVRISNTTYMPEPVLIDSQIEEQLNEIWDNKNFSDLDRALELFLYISKIQVFYDGNKRTSLLVASYCLINNGVGAGILITPNKVNEYKKHLLKYYENDEYKKTISDWLKINCIEYTRQFKQTEEYNEILKIK